MKLFRFARRSPIRYGVCMVQQRLHALKLIADRLIPGYRLTWPQLDWWRDADFNEYLDRFGERDGFNAHRRFMLSQLLRLADQVEGDTAECGVFQGAGSWLICSGNRGRRHHLFDSFEGLSEPSPEDGNHWRRGKLAADETCVRERLNGFAPRTIYHKGWIPGCFEDAGELRFAFAHIDVDLYRPTLESIAFVYPRMNAGGVIVCDDYGFSTCPGATKAIDEYLADEVERIVMLDAGGCFLIKG